MKKIHSRLMREFLKHAGDKLSGEWVLIGGGVLVSLGIEYRPTVDIDFISIHIQKNSQSLKLMEIAEELGLPVEAVNQAGALFLHRIPDFKKHLKVLFEGKNAKIYRPDLWLYFKLKIARLSSSDLEDCLQYLMWARKNNELGELKSLNILLSDKKTIGKLDDEARLRLSKLCRVLKLQNQIE